MSKFNVRLEVMNTIEPQVDSFMEKYLVPVEKIWQPSDYLPDPESEGFIDEIKDIRGMAKEMPYDFWIVLIGDMVTEEALPTYESWLLDVEGVDQHEENGWSKWVRHWTAEENRHGDVLNKYLYLSGRVNMREVEKTIQHLIKDGYQIETGRDPYKNFVYTSFQELATNISHKRVGKLAKAKGNKLLSSMCKIIAGDEMRHYLAYQEFVSTIFKYDPSEMMLAFYYMMKKKIVMPAHYLRESGGAIGSAYVDFSNAAQRLGVYTGRDYIAIMERLIKNWDIGNVTGLTPEAEKARDKLMALPGRMTRLIDRIRIPEESVPFKWVDANGM